MSTDQPIPSSVTEESIERGQSVYSHSILNMYDIMVLNLSNLLVWQSKRSRTQQFFQDNISNNHLDIGVGTGYFLAHCKWDKSARIGLMDMNQNCLDSAKSRIQHLHPETYQHDVFKPFHVENKFDSCSLNFLFHCLPGTVEEKVGIIRNIATGMNPGGTIFGTTVIHTGGYKSIAAEQLMKFYNKKGIFNNEGDSLAEYSRCLNAIGTLEVLEVIGTVCFFKITLPD